MITAKKLKEIFVDQVYGSPTMDNDELGITHGIIITLLKDPFRERRYAYRNGEENWLRAHEQTNESGNPSWDIKTDGTQIVHFRDSMNLDFYGVKYLTDDERLLLKEEKTKKDIERTKRDQALSVLTEKLIQKMPPLHYLETGDLEINHGIHLKEFKRDMHMNMPYKPRYGNIGWVANRVLCWGAQVGWDVTLDAKIVCCRVQYDDYINYEVQLLTDEEIENYKRKYQQTDSLLINRMATLTELLHKQLISETEYLEKKKEILGIL